MPVIGRASVRLLIGESEILCPSMGQCSCLSLINTSLPFIHQDYRIPSHLLICSSVVQLPNKESEGPQFDSSKEHSDILFSIVAQCQ